MIGAVRTLAGPVDLPREVAPAPFLGLSGRGRLAEGMRSDVVRLTEGRFAARS